MPYNIPIPTYDEAELPEVALRQALAANAGNPRDLSGEALRQFMRNGGGGYPSGDPRQPTYYRTRPSLPLSMLVGGGMTPDQARETGAHPDFGMMPQQFQMPVDPMSPAGRAERAASGERFDPALQRSVTQRIIGMENEALAGNAKVRQHEALKQALATRAMHDAAQGQQDFGMNNLGFTPGIPADAMRRANGTMPSRGVSDAGVPFITDGRLKIPTSPTVGPQDAPRAMPKVNIGMYGSDRFDRTDPAQESAFQERLRNPSPGLPIPTSRTIQERLVDAGRRPEEAGMSFEEVMQSRRAASLDKQRMKDEMAATSGQRRNDYANQQIANRQTALAAGARSVEQAKADALAEKLNAQNGGGRRGIQITNDDRIARELDRMTAAGIIKTEADYWAAREKLQQMYGMNGGIAPPPSASKPAPKENKRLGVGANDDKPVAVAPIGGPAPVSGSIFSGFGDNVRPRRKPLSATGRD